MAVRLPVLPVKLPRSLTGAKNGQLLPSQLEEIGPSGWLVPPAARCWRMLKLAAEGDLGRPLTWTFGGTYRSFAAQSTVWHQRMTTTPTPAQRLRAKVKLTWDGKTWYLVTGAQVARPGTSNHGLGLAIDVAYGTHPSNATSVDAAWRDWAIANAHRFGFSFETQSEIWHLRYVAGDEIPQLVLDLEQFFAGPPSPPKPAPLPAPELPKFDPANGEWGLMPLVPHDRRPILDLASGLDPESDDRDWVLYAQWVMKRKTRFADWVPTTGVVDDVTKAIVAALQADPLINQYPDGIIGRDDWWWVDSLAGSK